jgi:YD repeat-containing protein
MKVDENLRNMGKMINYRYDSLGRLEKVDYPYMTDTNYTYGKEGEEYNRAGRIVRITDESGSTENYYGKLGETVKEVKRINRLTPYPEIKEAVFNYTYDYQGRMERITYPDGEIVTYSYNSGGEVERITGVYGSLETDYVEKIGYDEFGQRVYMKLGNGTQTRYTYDENRRWLKTIETDNPYRTLQKMDYTFDRVGNILAVTDESDISEVSQSYTYDGLYQLTGAEGTYLDVIHGYTEMRSTYTQSFDYDVTGNMLRKTSTNTVTPVCFFTLN